MGRLLSLSCLYDKLLSPSVGYLSLALILKTASPAEGTEAENGDT